MDLSPLIRSQNTGPLTVSRANPPTQNKYGGFDAATPVEVELDPVVVHTAGGRDLEQLPEADRSKETIQLYALERLYASDGDKVADRVLYQGRTYRVVRIEDYDQHGAVWFALAQLEEPAS